MRRASVACGRLYRKTCGHPRAKAPVYIYKGGAEGATESRAPSKQIPSTKDIPSNRILKMEWQKNGVADGIRRIDRARAAHDNE